MLKAHGPGLISNEELLDWVYNLLHPYPELFNQNPHALHLYAMACEEFGWADKAIAAYAESAAHVSLIEDPAREAAAYTALARQYYDCGDIDSASRAASQAMFLNLHVGDTPNWPSTGSMTSAFVRPKPNRAASPRRVWTGSPPPSATTPGQPGPFTPLLRSGHDDIAQADPDAVAGRLDRRLFSHPVAEHVDGGRGALPITQ
ncbi:hypothetical protein NFC73_11335 [Pseudarthrobacter sp. RMG13]|uniref:Tetratricopeptide repeat protein n=1 Tax=Pseudarthrobacter humi TaxID=2952523 RepID=A0ABT1LR90_9MICC|nr:hypothetical protein [Pseudarthrobacter humi]MCP9000316.1 hypothetical protein [Pseudarthrobacter humi]